jgi:biopolymer transport protein ExbB
MPEPIKRVQRIRWAVLAALGLLLVGSVLTEGPSALAQDGESGSALADQKAAEALEGAVDAETTAPVAPAAADDDAPSVNVLSLVFKGGWLMLPILVMSILVATVGVERGLGLRRQKIIPPELISGLGELGQQGGFDPRQAYRVCQQFPSTAATVIRAMLLKVGRPHSEVEHSVQETMEREAARLYGNVRTLNLAAAITPLMGLLGTVWGMIQAFFATANMPTGANKAEQLAQGIYVALVTTAGGLAVAIPAAVLAHYFEGRIQRMLREVDELLFSLLPQVERFEGKLRVSRQQLGEDETPPAETEPRPARAPAVAK